MVQLKEKTLEELKKMASKKKISGRSKMNKAQLVRALSKYTSKKMVGGDPENNEYERSQERLHKRFLNSLRTHKAEFNNISNAEFRQVYNRLNSLVLPPGATQVDNVLVEDLVNRNYKSNSESLNIVLHNGTEHKISSVKLSPKISLDPHELLEISYLKNESNSFGNTNIETRYIYIPWLYYVHNNDGPDKLVVKPKRKDVIRLSNLADYLLR